MRRPLLVLGLLLSIPEPTLAAPPRPRVYGYWPTWSGSPATFRWDLLTDVAFFSEGLKTDGTLSTASWSTTGLSMVKQAHTHGVRADLCVTRFDSANGMEIHTFLSNPQAVAAGINAMVAAVKQNGADGINIDFEFVDGPDKALFTGFVTALTQKLHADVPGSQVSLAVPASAYSGYDVAALGKASDFLFIMAYGFHWGGSDPGPLSPLFGSPLWGSGSIDSAISLHRSKVDPTKLVIGLPVYGFDYHATSDQVPTTKTPNTTANAVTWGKTEVLAAQHGRVWDPFSQTPYYIYKDQSGWRQCFYEDAESLGLKLDLALTSGIGGFGFWALNYEGSSGTFWAVVEEKLGRTPLVDGGADLADTDLADPGAADGEVGADLAGAVDGGPEVDAGEDATPPGGCAAAGPTRPGTGWPIILLLVAAGLARRVGRLARVGHTG